MSDKYDKAVAYLDDHPEEIGEAWGNPSTHRCGCLFGYISHEANVMDHLGRPCGCLTMIRCGQGAAETPALTDAIRADERIPSYPSGIRVEDLPVFAEWQRRIDRELGRA